MEIRKAEGLFIKPWWWTVFFKLGKNNRYFIFPTRIIYLSATWKCLLQVAQDCHFDKSWNGSRLFNDFCRPSKRKFNPKRSLRAENWYLVEKLPPRCIRFSNYQSGLTHHILVTGQRAYVPLVGKQKSYIDALPVINAKIRCKFPLFIGKTLRVCRLWCRCKPHTWWDSTNFCFTQRHVGDVKWRNSVRKQFSLTDGTHTRPWALNSSEKMN